jgi:iron complex transport system substrate-binding protein
MRIVSLLPSATEIICALGLRAQLVAVSHACDYPESVTELPRITKSIIPHNLTPQAIDSAVNAAVASGQALYQIDGDTLRELAPDLIVTQGICDVCAVNQGTVEAALQFLPDVIDPTTQVLSLSGKTFDGILRDIRRVAEKTKVSPEPLLTKLQQRWRQVGATRPKDSPRVLMLEWPEPPFYGGHWVPEMVAQAGGVDVMGQIGRDSARTSWTAIHQADPDMVIMMACGYGLAENVAFAQALYDHPQASRLRAVQMGQVYAADANSYFSRPATRIAEGAALLQQCLSGVESAAIPKVTTLVSSLAD